MGAYILRFGGRPCVVIFLAFGCYELLPPPPADMPRAMLASFLIMMALVFLTAIEALIVFMSKLDPLANSTDPAAAQQLGDLIKSMFESLGMAAGIFGKVVPRG
jgi:hypothetical protein